MIILRGGVPFLLLALAACSGSSTGASATGAGPASVDDSGTSGEPTSGDGGGADGGGGGAVPPAPPSGDLWIDANGVVLGSARTVPDMYGKAVVALIDTDGLTWGIDDGTIYPLDREGAWAYAGENCTGQRWIIGSPRPGITIEVFSTDPSDKGIYAVKSDAKLVSGFTYASAIDTAVTFNCLPNYDHAVGYGYASVDVLVPTAPAGTAPFHIERH